MALTLAECYNRVAVNLQDVNPSTGAPAFTYWRKAWLVDWINTAIGNVYTEVPQKRYVTFGANPAPVLPAHATAEYVLSTYEDIGELVSVQADKIHLEPKTCAEMMDIYVDFDTVEGTARFCVFNEWAAGVLKVIPDPGETLTSVRGIATIKAPVLVVTTDDNTPLPFDADYHNICEFYATARGYMLNAETQNQAEADRYMALYIARLAEYKNKQRRNFSVQGRAVGYEAF